MKNNATKFILFIICFVCSYSQIIMTNRPGHSKSAFGAKPADHTPHSRTVHAGHAKALSNVANTTSSAPTKTPVKNDATHTPKHRAPRTNKSGVPNREAHSGNPLENAAATFLGSAAGSAAGSVLGTLIADQIKPSTPTPPTAPQQHSYQSPSFSHARESTPEEPSFVPQPSSPAPEVPDRKSKYERPTSYGSNDLPFRYSPDSSFRSYVPERSYAPDYSPRTTTYESSRIDYSGFLRFINSATWLVALPTVAAYKIGQLHKPPLRSKIMIGTLPIAFLASLKPREWIQENFLD